MKKHLAVALAFFLAGALAYAESDTYFKPGTLTGEVGLGLNWAAFGAAVQGGVDYSLYQVPSFPLDLGVSARTGLDFSSGVLLGGYGTAHYSWKELGTRMDWLNRLETYLGLGIQVLPLSNVRFDGYVGTKYYFNTHWAVYLEEAYQNTVLGASYRF